MEKILYTKLLYISQLLTARYLLNAEGIATTLDTYLTKGSELDIYLRKLII